MNKSEVQQEGRVQYTERAFSQDAQDAMGGRIERALVELITNSDDSYARLEARGKLREQATIVVEVERHRKRNWGVVVRDRAEGMTDVEMKQKLTTLGGSTSGFSQGENVRGLLGRGAKDAAAFGAVTFESIKDDKFYRLILQPTGAWKVFKPRPALQKDRDWLHIIRGNGTAVTIDVDAAYEAPRHGTLLERLGSYYSLRDICSSPNRRVLLVNRNDVRHKGDRVTYRYPQGEVKVNCEVPLEGYPGAVANITIWRHSERFDEDKRSPYRQGGLLIKSRRAIHDVTLFGFDNDPYAEWLFGAISCAFIDDLVREYDRRFEAREPHPTTNPSRIISRKRDGLAPEHPFTRALRAAGEQALEPLVAEERARARKEQKQIESDETRSSLRRLASAAGRFISKKLEEMDETLADDRAVDGGELKAPLIIVPESCKIQVGERKTLTIIAKGEYAQAPNDLVSVTSDANGVVVEEAEARLDGVGRIEGASYGRIHVRGEKVGIVSALEARLNGFRAEALIHVVDAEVADPPIVHDFSFERDSYNLLVGKEKTIRVLAPATVVEEYGQRVTLYASHNEIVFRSAAGLELQRDSRLGCFTGVARVVGRQLGARGVIEARLGFSQCKTRVQVVQIDPARTLPLDFRIEPETYGNQRAIWDPPTGFTLKIAAQHPAVARYLGPARENYPGQHTPLFKLLLAEIVAENVSRRLMELSEVKLNYDKAMDVQAFYREHFRLTGEFLPIAHRTMLKEQDIASAAPLSDQQDVPASA